MYGHDGSAMRSRYDYYYSVSSPSLSQATNYFENQHASLFGDPVLPLLSQPVQQLPISQLPLPPPNTVTSSSTATYLGSGYTGAIATPLIDNFDQHLYESIRRNFLDHQNNNNINNVTSTSNVANNNNIADSLNKAQLWHQQSTSSSDSPPPEEYEVTRKRAGSAMSSYNHYDDGSYEFSPSKFSRALSAHSGSCRNLNNYSTETTSEYENNKTNNNLICDKSIPRIVKPKSAKATPIRSRATTPTSKFCHTITHAMPSSRPVTRQSSQISLGLTKKDNNISKSYPNAFTVLPSPVVSAPPTPKISKRKFFDKNAPDAYDAMESDWIIPPTDKLMEANSHKMKSLPTSPIITNKIKIGSDNRIPTATSKSHRKLAFAIINEHKGRRHKLEHRHSEDNISGRLSPYTRYRLQREYLHLRSLSPESAPPLHTIDLLSGEFDPYVYDEYNQDEQDGRKTSIGFIHKRALSSSAINLTKRPRSVHPERKNREQDIRYQSTPNFVKLNKKSLNTQQQHKHIYFPILKRKQKGIVQVYSNTHVMRKTFSLDNITLADEEPPSIIDRNLLTPMPIDNDAKRHRSLIAHQKESRRKRKAMKRGLSPIVGTPNKDEKPGRKRMTDRERREMFGLVAKRQPKKQKEEDDGPVGDAMLGMGMATNLFAAPPPTKKMNAIRNITSLLGRKKETGPPPPTTPAKPKAADSLVSQMMARNVLARNLKARAAAKEPPKPLTKQPSKQSILSVDSTGSAAAAPEGGLKKKGSFASLKSISRSIRTVASMTSHRSSSIDEEAAEAADQVPVLESEKKDIKKKLQSGMSKLTLTNRLVPKQSRVTSAKGAKTKDPAPSRTASKASLRSVAASAKTVDSALSALGESQPRTPTAEPPQPTPSKASSEKLVPLSKFSIASMTTAAITSQPLAVTTTITNELARQGAEKKEAAVAASVASSATEKEAATSQKAETQSISSIKTMASIRTLTSRKTDSKPSSRKTSAKKQERATSSRPGSRIFISAANTAMAVRAMMKSTRSNDSIDSIHSDATQITLGQGNGADNQDVPSVHLSDNQDTVSMRTSRLALSRHSTKLDMQTPARQAAQGASSTHLKTSHSKTSLMADTASINAINVMQETDLQMQEQMMMEEDEDEYEEDDMGSAPDMQEGMEMSSSMNDVSRKRRWCGSLCACCDRSTSEEDVNDDQPKTCGQKFCSCCCLPFRKLCLPFKRRRRNDGTAVDPDKPSLWQRLCCCSSCCRKKKDGQKDPKKAKSAKSAKSQEPGCFRSCLSRLNCFKCCKPCCGRMSDCCCGCCKKKTPSTMALQGKEQRTMDQEEKPGLCKRIFCCCCLKCGKKKPPPPIQRRGDSIVSDPRKQRNCCYRMLSKIFCCCMKKDEDSRRTSMLSKKQSLAPTIPPPEDNKPKLDMTLVEHASIMKGAIPVLPIFLAWWCLIFNIFIPGTGTIFSGFFCLCLGIPRFSQHDRIRARIGAFVINCIVGVSQAFTIIFCLVGWGWSIWWGTTMLNLARKHKKMKDAELNNNEQAETGTISTKSSQPVRKQPSSKDRDVEAGKK